MSKKLKRLAAIADAQRLKNLRFNQPRIPHTKPVLKKVLEVRTEHFCATSLWQRIYGIWSCVQAEPTIRWMKGMTPDKAQLALIKMQASYSWLPYQDARAAHSIS